ncbi:DoxX family protein [Pedobacter sp. P351]|uniref:DoxX family protein n=1 Tax=Pedobacter superstes TaxID=3133441 RepID=UPI00309B43A8
MTKRNKIIPARRIRSGGYWIATVWLALGMLSTGIVQVLKMKEEADMFTHLGYPGYLLVIIGIWKILGVVTVLSPKFPLLKEWAYAGFLFAMSGAIFSHLAQRRWRQRIFWAGITTHSHCSILVFQAI